MDIKKLMLSLGYINSYSMKWSNLWNFILKVNFLLLRRGGNDKKTSLQHCNIRHSHKSLQSKLRLTLIFEFFSFYRRSLGLMNPPKHHSLAKWFASLLLLTFKQLWLIYTSYFKHDFKT